MCPVAYKVEARLELKAAEWFQQRLRDTKKTKSELLQELISDRIALEANPFGWIANQKNKPLKKTTEGYFTLIPDFPTEPQGGTQN